MAFAPMFFRLDKGYTEVNIQGETDAESDGVTFDVFIFTFRFLGTVHVWNLWDVQE